MLGRTEGWVGGGPKGGGEANISRFFFSPTPFSLFLIFSLGGCSRGIVAAGRGPGPPTLRVRAPQRSPNAHLGWPWPRPAATVPREPPLSEREKRRRTWEREKEKKREILGGSAEGGPGEVGPTEGSRSGGPGEGDGGGKRKKKRPHGSHSQRTLKKCFLF